MLSIYSDDYFMSQAIKEAEKARDAGEIPVGAIIVCQKQIIARAYNQTQLLNDVTAHAEILAITAAEAFLGNKYLKNCTVLCIAHRLNTLHDSDRILQIESGKVKNWISKEDFSKKDFHFTDDDLN